MTSNHHVVFVHNEDEQIKSLGTPSGRRSSTCGYCSPPGRRSEEYTSYRVAGLDATKLTCEVCSNEIDIGSRS